jgi:hypothetical protein
MYTFVLAFTLQCFFPLFDLGAGEFVGMSVVNRDIQQQDFTVTVTAADGRTSQSGVVTLPAGNQRAFLLSEILNGKPVPASGSVRVDKQGTDCSAYLTDGDAETLTGTDAAASLSTSILLPHIEVNTGFAELGHTDTSLVIVSPNDAAAVTVQLFGLDGVSRGSVVLSVPAFGTVTSKVSTLFNAVLPNNGLGGKGFQGYIRLMSDKGVAAWARLETPLARAVLRGQPVSEIVSTTRAVIPHFVFGPSFGSTINLVNPTSATVELEMSAHDDRGNTIDTVPVRLLAGEARRSSVGEFFKAVIMIFPPPTFSGYVTIREKNGGTFQVVGNVEIFGQQQGGPGSAVLYPLSSTPSASWLLPFAASSNSYFTGYAIVNPNELLTVQTDVVIEILDSAGLVRSRSTASLSPMNRITGMIPAGLSSGYVRVTANFPVHLLGSIGTLDGRQLDQIPAIRP